MNRLLACLLVVAWLVPNVVHANRVYRLVDVPLLQAGHTLEGTITTTDDAPLDSLLETDEILAWQWVVTGPRVLSGDEYVATHDGHIFNDTLATGVQITVEEIMLPLSLVDGEFSQLMLASSTPLGGRGGALSDRLEWTSRFHNDGRNTVTTYIATQFLGDVGNIFWIDESSETTPPTRLIAVAVPEPSCLVICSLGWLGLLFGRRP